MPTGTRENIGWRRALKNMRSSVLWAAAIVVGVLALAAPAHAARTINSVVLSYGLQTNVTSVTVPPGATISATVNVTHTGSPTGRRWRSTAWRIGSSGTFSCADHVNFDSSGTDSVTFSITAPATTGTYNAGFIAYQADGCTTNPSATFTLTGGVVVVGTLDNSTVTADPTTVAADGTSASTITVTLRDGSGNPVAGKNVALAALTGSSTISAPSGPSDANGVVTFSVRDSVVESVTYTATNTTDGVTLSQTATVNFVTPALVLSFNAVEPGADAIAGKLYTKVAGAAFALDIVALRGGAIDTKFTGTVAVEIVDATSGAGCSSLPLIARFSDQTFTTGDKGRHRLSSNTVADVYRNTRVRIKFPATLPTIVSCSGDNFAIRPSAFTALRVSDNDAENPGTLRTLDNVAFDAKGVRHKAGRSFTVSASAINAAAKPAVTTNYSGTPIASLTACTGAACTASFGAFSLGTSFSAGQLAANAATYREVGSFALQLVDSTFASVDAADGSTAAARNIVSPVINVGRFVPDHFAISLNSPQFGTACATGSFTYVGQPFGYTIQPVITVTAQDLNDNTTALYTGAWWRITSSSVTPATQGERYSGPTGKTLDLSRLPAVTADPEIIDTGAGTGRLTFSSGTGISFARTTPASPYNADLGLELNVIDADGVAYTANPARFGAATAGSGIAFSNGKEMRFGRSRLQNAHGSQLISMPIPIQAQYWNGTVFVPNTADSCTAIASANVALGNYRRNLSAGETTVSTSGTLNAGAGTLRLSAPGAGNDGSVDVSINLTTAASGASCTAGMPASTPAGLSHLQGAWCGAAYTNDPTARATFGVYRNSDRVIFQRENY